MHSSSTFRWTARHVIGDEPFAVLLPDMLMVDRKPCLNSLVGDALMEEIDAIAALRMTARSRGEAA